MQAVSSRRRSKRGREEKKKREKERLTCVCNRSMLDATVKAVVVVVTDD